MAGFLAATWVAVGWSVWGVYVVGAHDEPIAQLLLLLPLPGGVLHVLGARGRQRSRPARARCSIGAAVCFAVWTVVLGRGQPSPAHKTEIEASSHSPSLGRKATIPGQ